MSNNNIEYSMEFLVPDEVADCIFGLFGAYSCAEESAFGDDGEPDTKTLAKEADVTEAIAREALAVWCDYEHPCEDELVRERHSDGTRVIIYSEECGMPDIVADLLAKVYVLTEYDHPLGFAWAERCSKPCPGEFGGGAVLVSRERGVEWVNTGIWLQDAAEGRSRPLGQLEREALNGYRELHELVSEHLESLGEAEQAVFDRINGKLETLAVLDNRISEASRADRGS